MQDEAHHKGTGNEDRSCLGHFSTLSLMNLKEKNTNDFVEFEYYLEKISDSLQRSPFKWYFGVKLCEFDNLPEAIKNVVGIAYANAYPEQATLERKTFAEMVARLNQEFSMWLKPRGENADRVRPIVTEYSDLWWCLGEYIDFRRSQIYEYLPTNQLDEFGSGGLFGNFAFVIIDEETRHILFFSGGDSD
jgi:hypothetical protein